MHRTAAQRHRINRVVNHTRGNLADSIDLNHMADVACLSKFHFARVFQDRMNETPVQFLWRTRLDHAIRTLVLRPDQSILNIAMDHGFSGAPTLSRAFRQRFGYAPRTVRKTGLRLLTIGPDVSAGATLHPDGPVAAARHAPWRLEDVRIEERPTLRVAYVRHVGPYWDADGGISRAFQIVKNWARSNGLWQDTPHVIGICPDNSSLTPASQCIYDACVRVPDDVPEDDTVSIRTIAGGTYAVLRVDRTIEGSSSGWNWLTLEWLPRAEYTYELSTAYEIDPRRAALAPGEAPYTELCLKISRT